MTSLPRKHQFLLISLCLVIIMWLADSFIHYYAFHEELNLIPETANELWMRTVIAFLLVFFGTYVDHHNKVIMQHEAEKLEIYKATIHSTQHILNNLLNQMQLFRMELDNPGRVQQSELKETFESCFAEGKDLVKKLSSVDQLSAEKILQSVDPASIDAKRNSH
ncbi:MAG: hypothetical protein OEY00_09970 [Gammaproteobacteria bacterium]|nr:hypothetical protein [Gammaproteobacteria bacterium]